MVLPKNQALNLERLQQQVADQTRKLSAVHDILEAVSTPAELPVILNRALKAALVAAQGDAGIIHLRDKSGKTMRLVARQGISDSVAESIATVSSEDGLLAWVMRNRKSLLIPNIGEDARTVYLAASGDLKVYVGVPISRGQRVWGTLSILGMDPSQFGDEEVALLISVGEEIGLVVENARLRRQTERLLVVQERNRLARELHDSVTQSLYSVTLFAEAGRRTAIADKNEEVTEYFTQIGETGQQALKEMRLLIHKLRPSILAKEGLVRAIQQRLNSVEGRAGIKSQLIVEGEARLSPLLEDALYQIAQEALNNALKHAMASEVIVCLDFLIGEQVVIRIEDNGRGFDLESAADSDGMGLMSMKERAEIFGGKLTIQSTPGQGSTVEARLSHTKITPRQKTDFDVEDLP
jgi:signal transduction histidine kinase